MALRRTLQRQNLLCQSVPRSPDVEHGWQHQVCGCPYIAIRDTVTVEGRITKRKLAYEVFMDAVAELEKKQNDFRTIVVDLLEDVYESCRVYICDRQGWKHESDDSFRAWDMVRSEFLNTLKRLVNLDYENII